MTNQKYEITDIVHEKYPFLHRIRALRDIGDKVRAGDLGGFVEHEDNLSFKPGDDAWIFGDAIAAGCSCVDQGARLFGKATVCDHAYVSQGAEMSGEARAEDFAYIRGSVLCGHARATGQSMILNSTDTGRAPSLSENCVVYGTVIQLSTQQFQHFSANLLRDMPFIAANKDLTGYDKGVTRCLLVTTRRNRDGILVNSEGYNYARYAAYVRDIGGLKLEQVPVEQYRKPRARPER